MKVLIAGDFVPRNRVAAQIEMGDYSCLNDVKSIIQGVDYAIVNFESPVVTREAKPITKTGPNLRCTERAVECLKQAGFRCLTLANNHFRDYGQIGVEDTLSVCMKYDMDYVGGGRDIAEAEKILYKDLNGQRLAIINICENEWSIAGDNYGGSAPLNPVKNYYAIKEARRHSDYVIVIVHGGIEMYQYPTPRMVDTYRFFIDAGADVVVNHHQHCYSGYEEYHGKPIFYGLGNFCMDSNVNKNSAWNDGYMIELQLDKNVVEYNLLPYKQCEEHPSVSLICFEDKTLFAEKIKEINEVINKPESLLKLFQYKTETVYEKRLLALEPFSTIDFIRHLQRKHLFPRLIRKEQCKSMLHRLSCESNNELLRNVLKKYFNL